MSIDVCVVDLGCGSGLWCLEVADEFPNVKVVGVDISPVQPIHDVPVNCDFLMDNLLDGLPFDTGSVDFSQSRCIMAGIPDVKWPTYAAEVFRVLKPGTGISCFIELNPRSSSLDHDVSKLSLRQWEDLVLPFIEQKGMIMGGHRLVEFVTAAGFIDIQLLEYKIPCGTWAADRNAKLSGRHGQAVWLGAIDSLDPILRLVTPGWGIQDREELVRKVKMEIQDTKLHLYSEMHCVIAKKPV